ncbi:MAG: TonB-dependent receptor [Proteobacteria bacterium]|nr:TonB-dependent receptor [Pseudomonadota bacterium]MBU1386743.1 TonB-dependent receptor [Pseudomonadota bacterium]MBU1544687.1 TonB-dependent receptor [Pseudomonadota bacterium]MBU2480544.1 TonB-dependent receptor [Pseudomonadota bacterium]
MKKKSNRMIIWTIVVLFVFSYSGSVMSEEKKAYNLGDITVTAAKFETSIEKSPTNLDVITREDIERMPEATNINELLRQVPGLYVPQYQSGVANDGLYSSRGSEPSTWGLRFLVNGIEFNKGNGYTVPTRIPINDIERMEIIKTASAEYGDQAVGGVINVVTRVSPKPLEAKAGFSYGSFDYTNYFGVINGSNDRWEYFMDFSFSQTDGYQDNVFYDPANFYTRFAYKPDDTMKLEFHGSHMASKGSWPKKLTQVQFDADSSQNPGKSDTFENDYNLAALVLKKKIGDDELQIKLTGKDEWVTMNYGSDFEFDEWEIIPAITYALKHEIAGMGNTVLFGGEYRKHEIINQMFTVLNGVRQTKTKDTLREDISYAAYIIDELSVTDALTVSFGARFDSYEQNQTGRVNVANTVGQSDEAISPKLGATYTINNALNVFAGFNSGFKSPARVPGAAYSSGLDPEEVRSYEVGFRGSPLPWLNYNTALFLNQYKNKWIRTGPNPTDPYTNAGETEAKGIELSLNLSFNSGLYSSISYTYQESKYEDFIDSGVNYNGNWLANIPEQLIGLTAGYNHSAFGQISLTADYIGDRYFNQTNTLKGNDYWVFGAKYKKTFDQWNPAFSFFVNAKNLGDEAAVVYGSGTPGSESLVPVYGRSVTAGIEFLF